MKLAPLLDRAFRVAPAASANAVMAEVREEHLHGGTLALSYEVVLSPEWDFGEVAARVVPQLIYFLECRGSRLPLAPGVFLSLFVGDCLYFVEVHDFLDVIATQTAVPLEELVRRRATASP